MTDDDNGFESLRKLIREIAQDIKNLYRMVLELQKRVSSLEGAVEQGAPPDLTESQDEWVRPASGAEYYT